nr:immunoglobulin heavy chain junction region [Mus musculus]MBK4188136.1 immunoglobulin heavy chain junction region [Mus musculus]MBK4188137.1 immunoglobulin heavy chain junction region [Mus musculus]MBK4188138.1 immunoglobulin heavy chain junction region [Mus musculus]
CARWDYGSSRWFAYW